MACGWLVLDHKAMNIMAGPGVAVREFPLKAGPADYLLYADGKVIGVLEAKPEGHTLKGVEIPSSKYTPMASRITASPCPLPMNPPARLCSSRTAWSRISAAARSSPFIVPKNCCVSSSSTRRCAPYDEGNEEGSMFESASPLVKEPLPVVYSAKVPIETFDFIVIDEGHRSIVGEADGKGHDRLRVGTCARRVRRRGGRFERRPDERVGHHLERIRA